MSTCPPSETTEGPAIVVDAHHFILCQHGVLGSSNDLTGVVREVIISHDLALESHAEPKVPLSSLWSRQPTERHAQRRRAYAPPRPASGAMRGDARVAVSGNLWCFTPTNNNFFGTVVGTEGCAMGLLEESLPVVEAWLDAVHEYDRANVAPIHNAERADDGELEQPSITPPPEVSRAGAPPRCFSCIGHSFGGLILREYLFLLFTDDSPLDDASLGLSTRHLNTLRRARQLRQRFALEHISLENYATIASPHCGAAECLPRVLYWGAWVLRQLPYFSRTSGELLLTDKKHQLEQRLVDGPHLLALQLFRRRVLFANTHRDLLVGFGTGSLIYETVEEDLAKAFGDSPQSAPCASAFESDDAEVSAPILLSPYEATEEERSMLIHYYATRGISFDEGSTDEANLAYLHHHTHIRSFTLDDLQLLARHSTTEEDGSEAVVAGGRSPAPSCTSSAATTTPIVIVGSPASRPHTFPVAEVVSAADVMAFHRRRVKQHTPPPTTTTTTHASAELTDTPLGELHNSAIGAEPPSTAVVRLRPTEKRMFCWLYELRLISGVRALGQAAATLYRRHASPIRSRGGLFRRPASAGDGVRDAPPLYDESTRPRAIAYRLRRHLTWQVRAVRYRSAIPMAHIAVLGNWGPLGDSSDSIVLSIAEELSQVLL